MDEREPVGIHTSERHVGPHVGGHQQGGNVQRHQDHQEGICWRSIKGIEKPWVGEHMVRLVGCHVYSRLNLETEVLRAMHDVLQCVLNQELCQNMKPVYPAMEAIVGCRHQAQHPCAGEIAA